MQMYFFERLLYRISISKYKNNFILKGGLLLSILFGDERRTTQDNLRKAIISTFNRREKSYLLSEIEERFDVISNSSILKSYWNNFKKSHIYASNISYDEVINKIKEITNIMTNVTV